MSEQTTVRAVVIDHDHPGHLRLGERALRAPHANEATVKVHAISLNRGELKFASGWDDGRHIGWDVAGVVERPADAGGPPAGTRVVAFCRAQDGWASHVHVPTDDLAAIPDAVSDAVAASLPVASCTALACIDAGPRLLGRRALITGVTGGVGGFALQLAAAAGADVVAQVRRENQVAYAECLGAQRVVVTSEGAEFAGLEPVHLVADGIGGALFGNALRALHSDGVAVTYGVTNEASTALSLGMMLGKGRASIRGLNLYAVTERTPACELLERVLALVAQGKVESEITDAGSWDTIGEAAVGLLERRFRGKAVVSVG